MDISIKQIKTAISFTEAYKKYTGAHPAIREVMCVAELYPSLLPPIKEDDTFAGALGEWKQDEMLPLVFAPQYLSQIGYTMNISLLRRLEKSHPEYEKAISDIIEFWKKESTFVKIYKEAPKDIVDYLFPEFVELDKEDYRRLSSKERPLGAGFISGSFDTRVAGITPDFTKLIKLGLPGLRAEISDACQKNPKAEDFYFAADKVIDILEECCLEYSKQATALGLTECAEILSELTRRPPQTLREGIQLILIFTTVLHNENYGRLDVALGDLLDSDLKSERLDDESAVGLICEFWKKFEKFGGEFDSRIVIGGVERSNESAADKFALLAMEATRRRHAIVPVLTLRWTNEQNPALLEKALELISEGCIYPTLYNDDAFIPGVMKGMHVPYEYAAKYFPLGCGEIVLANTSIGSPNSTFRFLKALEATLHNGRDAITGNLIGIETGELESFDTYDTLECALFEQIRAGFERDVSIHIWNRKITARETAYVQASLLTDCCIERGLGLHAGGPRYFGANVEGFGQTNTANSLAVIKKLVYEEKRLTLRELVNILDKNYEGYEDERRLFMQVEKYGNNSCDVDDIKLRLDEYINRTADEIGRANGLDYYTVANVNPGGITIGPTIAASADGRYCGTPMALGNSPQPGTDKNGITAMLLSAVKTDSANGGVVTNMNLSRKTAVENRDMLKSAILTYFDLGGLQLNINCFSSGDLEKALEHPADYQNLIVRVSGYSARFVDLDPITQKEIMKRTLY